ncbi:MAG: response regulator [Bacteroidales bacterium]|nr:response regulator [Bacteroidales bacterium]
MPYEVDGIKKDGSIFTVENEARNIFDEKNNEEIRVTAFRDVSKRRKAEDDLKTQNEEYAALNEEFTAQNEELSENYKEIQETNKELALAKEKAEESNRLKTEFLNNMSHEIRTPLNGIIGFSNLLNKASLNDEKKKNYINIINNSGLQLLRVIDDILEISKLETKQVKIIKTKVNLNDILLNLFSIFDIKAKEKNIRLFLKKGLSDNQSIIYIDESKLFKILSNIIENSLKFTNSGFIEIGYKKIENSIEIYVKDTGIGININNQEIIFEHFSQEEKEISQKVGGLGLGLSIAKENAELIGGKITLISEKSKGSTFFITIPYQPAYDANTETISTEKSLNKKKEYTILIAEDEEVNYIYIETLLEEFEHKINFIHAKNGIEAIDFCKKSPNINLILMDIKMPVLNGYKAAKEIRNLYPEIPIIAQNAYSTSDEKNKALKSGCDDFISKPISEKALINMINKHLK